MKNNINNYNSYKDVSPEAIEDDDIVTDFANYPQDSYVKPGESKVVGKMDDYNKDKEKYNKQKSKIVLNESNIAPQEKSDKSLDDLIPADIGNAIDNVFSKVDNLLNATGKLFFGGKPKAKPQVKENPKPIYNKQTLPKPDFKSDDKIVKDVEIKGNSKVITTPNVQIEAKPILQVAQQPVVQTKPATVQPTPKPIVTQQPAYKSSIIKPKTSTPVITDEDDSELDNGPLVTRTTMISDLDLPIELLNDPDLVRYFDQMKLYDKKVDGGLCSVSQKRAADIIKKGRWGKVFMISYDQFKINTISSTADAGISRFQGMLPVYKAQGRKFTNTEELRRAIEKDINMYIKNGQGSGEFHKFTYRRK